MESAQIREELHHLINIADDRLLNLIYDVMKNETREEDLFLSDEHKNILVQRLAEHKAFPSDGSSWSEVKARIKKKA
ncbi:MAG: hypothetical protein ABI663_19190 [Chryseolinea sp.]